MVIHLSFTKTFFAWFRGEVSCVPEDRFRFNCCRNHIFGNNPNEVPFEITWTRPELKKYEGPVYAQDLPKELVALWKEFLAIIALAEKMGNVWFRKPGTDGLDFPDEWLTEEDRENRIVLSYRSTLEGW